MIMYGNNEVNAGPEFIPVEYRNLWREGFFSRWRNAPKKRLPNLACRRTF